MGPQHAQKANALPVALSTDNHRHEQAESEAWPGKQEHMCRPWRPCAQM